MQTFLVHARSGWDLRDTRDPHFLTFLLIIGGKVVVNFINPLMWVLTILYFVFRATPRARDRGALPAADLLRRAHDPADRATCSSSTSSCSAARGAGNHDLIKYGLLAPAYWLLMSVASCKALVQLILKPHYWEKTVHGLHLQQTASAPHRADAPTSLDTDPHSRGGDEPMTAVAGAPGGRTTPSTATERRRRLPSLSVVMPAHDEAENIEAAVVARARVPPSTVTDRYEVVVVDDGSTDGTDAIVESLAAGRTATGSASSATNATSATVPTATAGLVRGQDGLAALHRQRLPVRPGRGRRPGALHRRGRHRHRPAAGSPGPA